MLYASLNEINFRSEFDSLGISAVVAMPSGAVRGIVQIVHGMNEYKERYFDFMDYLAEQGFITAVHDNRGHGASIQKPDDLGFLFRNGGKGYVADIAQFNRYLKKEYRGIPFFLLGHSMGSLGARCFIKEHDSDIDGLFLLGSPSELMGARLIKRAVHAYGRQKGSRYRSEFLVNILEGMYNRKFGGPPHSWISTRKDVVEEFNANPKSNYMYTVNGFESLMYLLVETYSKDGWSVSNPGLPIRFISGRDDPVKQSDKSFLKAVHMLEDIGYERVTHRLFDGMRHEVLNEKKNQAVYRDISKTLFSWTKNN